MTALTMLFALVGALGVGYYFGRRAGTSAPTWKKRTSRAAMGKLALSLVALAIARRIHRSLVATPATRPAYAGVWALPAMRLQLLRGNLARLRFK